MRTIDFIAQNEQTILNYYGFEVTNNKHVDCKICNSKKSFRINNYQGSLRWICKCGSGGVVDLLMKTTSKDFVTLANEIDLTFGNDSRDDRVTEPKVNDRLSQAIKRWREIKPVEGTQAQDYLNARGISVMPRQGVKFSEKEFNSESGRFFPCMYAIASNEYGEAIQRHLTYLDGTRKAPVEKQKIALSLQEYSGPISVKLFPVKSTLGIAEGIETALSAHTVDKLPVWSTLNATLMKKFRAPTGVDTLIIYADNDLNGTGLACAMECANRNLLSPNYVERVIVKWPEKPDFNDYLLEGGQIFQLEFMNKH